MPATTFRMTKLKISFLVGFVVLFGVVAEIVSTKFAAVDGDSTEEHFDSPRLTALALQLTGGASRGQAMIDKLWDDQRGSGPLIEPVASDPHSMWVTFLWRGDNKTHRVAVRGGPPTGELVTSMKRFGQTDLWYRTDRIPDDARFNYFFQVNRPLTIPPGADKSKPLVPARPDPLNPRTAPTQDMSLLELPSAPSQPWLDRASGSPQGELSKCSLQSDILNQKRTFTIYKPPNYEPNGEAYRLLVLFDGEAFQNGDLIPAPVILDNLIGEKKIQPLVTVFVNHIHRDEELRCTDPFGDFIASELMPWVRSNVHGTSDPRRSIVGGVSRGGLMASYCAYRHSDVFGNVLSLSGSYWWFPAPTTSRRRQIQNPAG